MAKKKAQQSITWTNERRKLSDLIPWDRNPRTIKNAQAERLVDSVETFGQVETLAINPDNGVLNGHQRLSVLAGQYGMDYEVDVRVASRELTERERQQLTVYLHKGAAGEWVFDDLLTWDHDDLITWGFDAEELNIDFGEPTTAGTDTDTAAEIDRAEELGQKWQTAEGQIWRIAEHFVICGDCREPATWQRLLQAANVDKVNGVFTSPPYAMQRKDQYGGVPTAEYVDWWEALQANVKANLASDGSFFVNIKAHCEDKQRVLYCMDLVCASVRKWGWRFFDEWIWNKNGLPGDYGDRARNDFEPIYHFCLGDIACRWNNVLIPGTTVKGSGSGSEKQGKGGSNLGKQVQEPGMVRPGNVITTSTDQLGDIVGHAAAFPVALPDFFIRAYSDPGDVWCDPFLGSGTTIVAAHNNKRRGLGSEKLPKYLGVILERLATHTNTQPELID